MRQGGCVRALQQFAAEKDKNNLRFFDILHLKPENNRQIAKTRRIRAYCLLFLKKIGTVPILTRFEFWSERWGSAVSAGDFDTRSDIASSLAYVYLGTRPEGTPPSSSTTNCLAMLFLCILSILWFTQNLMMRF